MPFIETKKQKEDRLAKEAAEAAKDPLNDPTVKGRVKPKARSLAQKARITTYIFTGSVSAAAFLLMVGTALKLAPWNARYATDLFLVSAIFGAGPFAFFYNRDLKRIEAINEKFPDFLRDLAESARAGMTLPRALVNASRGTYGTLSEEIKIMAAQVEWGIAFDEALQRFADRIKSPLITRIASLIIEAQRSGGSVVDVLSAASDDAREIQQIVEARNGQMAAYSMVIYISFFVFLAVVLVLQAQFIPAFKVAVDAAAGSGTGGRSVGGLSFKKFEPEDFNTMFFHAGIAQALGGGLVGGVLTKGNPVAGVKGIIVMLACAWVCFRFVTGYH